MNIKLRDRLRKIKPKLEWHKDPVTKELKSQGMCHMFKIYLNISGTYSLDNGMYYTAHDTIEEAKQTAEEYHLDTLCTELGV